MPTNNPSSFEKWALSILGLVIIGLLGWVGKTVNNNQVQYARIEERLTNQTVMLTELNNKYSARDMKISSIERELALLKQQVNMSKY